MGLREVETPFKSITNGIKIGFKNLIVLLKSQVQFILCVRGNIQECIKACFQTPFRFKQGLRGEIKKASHNKIWANETSDIWFATKTDEFLFKQHPIGVNTIDVPDSNNEESNLWIDIPLNKNDGDVSRKNYYLKY